MKPSYALSRGIIRNGLFEPWARGDVFFSRRRNAAAAVAASAALFSRMDMDVQES